MDLAQQLVGLAQEPRESKHRGRTQHAGRRGQHRLLDRMRGQQQQA
jgi:hypothetical protein